MVSGSGPCVILHWNEFESSILKAINGVQLKKIAPLKIGKTINEKYGPYFESIVEVALMYGNSISSFLFLVWELFH